MNAPVNPPPGSDAAPGSPERVAQLRAQLVRHVDAVPHEAFERPPLYASSTGALSDGTAARKLGAAVDTVPPGQRACPYHYHLAQEEMFVMLAGEGHLRVAGEMLPVCAGDVIFIPPGPEYPHQLINTSAQPIRYLSISTQERPEVCHYPDSGKTAAFAPGVRLVQRAEANLDYWDGEP